MTGSGDEFGRAVAQIGVAQLCEGIGFHAFQRSAAEALADIALRYLSDLAKAAHFYAGLAGRTECNALDVIMAMEDVGTGPASATDTSRTLANSKALQDVMRYVEYSEEIPFSRPLPHFPITKKRVAPPSFSQLGEVPPQPHIPAWLPAFPDPHTYKSTPVWDERKSDPRIDKLEIARQRRKAERSFVSLHLRLSSGRAAIKGPEPPSAPTEPQPSSAARGVSSSQGAPPAFPPSSPSHPSRQQWPPTSEQAVLLSKLESEGQQGKGKGKRVTAWQNPYLASPFPAGEKEVSLITFPGKGPGDNNGLQFRELESKAALPSVLETFPSALEVAKHGLVNPDAMLGSSGQSIPEAKDRRPVLMSFDWGRKARSKALSAQISIGALQRSTPAEKGKLAVPGKEEEKDDRKRRAEQILAQSYVEGGDDASQP
ncbi:unnamed protein product [Calypogeia fissa]